MGSPSDIHRTGGMKFGLFVTCGPVLNWTLRHHSIWDRSGEEMFTLPLYELQVFGFQQNKGRYVNIPS